MKRIEVPLRSILAAIAINKIEDQMTLDLFASWLGRVLTDEVLEEYLGTMLGPHSKEEARERLVKWREDYCESFWKVSTEDA